MRRDLPIVVLGGGPAGAVCAITLANAGHDVILLINNSSRQRGEFILPKTIGKLSGACQSYFPWESFHALDSIFSSWATPLLHCRDINFWNAQNAIAIDRLKLFDWLESTAENAGVNVLTNHNIDSCYFQGNHWQLELLSKSERKYIHASLIVESIGKSYSSTVVPSAKRFFIDNMICVTTDGPCFENMQNSAIVESVESGWFMSVATSTNQRITSFFTDADLVPKKHEMYSWFNHNLNTSCYVKKQCKINAKFEFQTCDARTSLRSIQWQDHWLPIGDAAFSLDPLSGDGIDRAVNDGRAGADAIISALKQNDNTPIADYARERLTQTKYQLNIQQKYYQQESRWPNSTFWHRRHTALTIQK